MVTSFSIFIYFIIFLIAHAIVDYKLNHFSSTLWCEITHESYMYVYIVDKSFSRPHWL